jgi:hypothetical protein
MHRNFRSEASPRSGLLLILGMAVLLFLIGESVSNAASFHSATCRLYGCQVGFPLNWAEAVLYWRVTVVLFYACAAIYAALWLLLMAQIILGSIWKYQFDRRGRKPYRFEKRKHGTPPRRQ